MLMFRNAVSFTSDSAEIMTAGPPDRFISIEISLKRPTLPVYPCDFHIAWE